MSSARLRCFHSGISIEMCTSATFAAFLTYCTNEHYINFLVPSATPINLRLLHRDSRSIIVEWDPIPEGLENVVLDGYKVKYWAKRHNQSAFRQTSNDEYTAVLDGLSYNTVYTIRVAAFTSSGSGDFSKPILVETKMCKFR